MLAGPCGVLWCVHLRTGGLLEVLGWGLHKPGLRSVASAEANLKFAGAKMYT